jgi:Zn-dependent protease with chaperone function
MGGVPGATAVRALLAALLVAGFYWLGVGLVAGLVALALWLWWVVPGPLAHDLSYPALAVAAGLVVPVRRVAQARPRPPEGLAVTVEQAPALWAAVRDLAAVVPTRPPDEIRLIAEVNAAVWEDTGRAGLRPGRRYLYVGVPLLETLPLDQLRAVLAHELGHYARGHTRFGALVYRGMLAMAGTIERIGPRTLPGLVLTGYAAVYAAVALAVLRRMETEADQAAVRAAGPTATAGALRDTERLVAAWDGYLRQYLRWTSRTGYPPAAVLAYFGAVVDDPVLVPDPVRPPHRSRWDSHPPLAQRLALVEAAPDRPVPADPRPAWVLLDDLELRAAALRTATFDESVVRIAQEDALCIAAAVRYAAGRVAGDRAPGLGTVLDLLEDGRAGELTVRLRRTVYGNREPVELVTATVAAALVASGAARWRHEWSVPLGLESADGDPLDVATIVGRAWEDPAAVGRLRELVDRRGPATDADRVPRWRVPLATGDVPDGAQLLPDDLLVIARNGRCRLDGDVLAAGLVAATLAELRLRGRVAVAATPDGTVRVVGSASTGDRFLDSVLNRILQAGPHPAYRWLQLLGPDVRWVMDHRLAVRNRRGAALDDLALAYRARAGIVQALHTGHLDGREIAFGALLWGVELTAPVLGWRAPVSRFWLGRIARRDRLAVAIRVVIGLHMPTPKIST